MSALGISWSYITIFALRIICNIKIEVQGAHNLPKSPYIIACKHQSALETVFFQQYLKFPVYVIKKELLKIPFYGWFLKHMGMIAIDRKGGISALKQMLRDCEKNLNQNRSIIIFPEGTRVMPLESVEYHAGILAIKKKFPKTPIIPIALNSGLFWPKNSWFKYPGTMTFKILPELDKNLDNNNTLYELKKIIDENSASLL
jgi:1-acyl-sn-glycerol-3-phosphate acyltransferase